jgi:hypothetical protein
MEKYGRYVFEEIKNEYYEHDPAYKIYDEELYLGYIKWDGVNKQYYFAPRKDTPISFSSSSLKGIANLCEYKTGQIERRQW